MRKVILEKLSSNSTDLERLRRGIDRDKYEGLMHLGPSVGHALHIYFDRNGGTKYDTSFHTSTIKNIRYEADNTLYLTTRNSEYKLVIGEEIHDN